MQMLTRLVLIVALAPGFVGCSPRAMQPDPSKQASHSNPEPGQAEPVSAAESSKGDSKSTAGASLHADSNADVRAAPAASTSLDTVDPTAVSKDDETDSTNGTARAPVIQAAVNMENPSDAQPTSDPAQWTSQRLVLMGKGGPRFIQMNVNVNGLDLEKGFRTALIDIARELSIDFAQPVDWNALLDNPLIASGWLGNLVPNSEQREQLRGMYDQNKNEKVDEDEFRSFLTRGLSRISPLRVFSRPSTAPRYPSDSPWGPVDGDASGDLSSEELADTTKTMMRFDYDGDRILTPEELRSATETDNNSGQYRRSVSMLDMSPLHAWDPDKSDAMARSVLENYTFGDSLSTSLLYVWPAARIARIDENHDDSLDLSELRKMDQPEFDGRFEIRLPDEIEPDTKTLSVKFTSIERDGAQAWSGYPQGGRLTLDGCIITIVVVDEQSESVRESFKTQFARFEKDSQLQSFALQALELKEGAPEVLKSSSERLQVAPEELAWRWLVTPRHWHVQIGWSASDSPWFELMDLNGDQKLVLAELEQFSTQAKRWDRNKDGALVGEEMPASVLLEVKRSEARGLRSRLGGTAVEKRGANVASAPTWFTGMDYNSDGELSQGEFLGERSDFEKLDLNRDGTIEVREVSTPQ